MTAEIEKVKLNSLLRYWTKQDSYSVESKATSICGQLNISSQKGKKDRWNKRRNSLFPQMECRCATGIHRGPTTVRLDKSPDACKGANNQK